MSVQVSYYELRAPERNARLFTQTPIFVGTATEKVVVSRKPGVFSLAIPQASAGCRMREDLFASKIKYWRIYQKGTISLIAPERYSIEINNYDTTYSSSPSELSACNLFIRYNNSIIFSSPLHSPEFKIIDGKFYLSDCTLLEKLPVGLATLDCILATPLTVENVPYTTHDQLVEILPLTNQLTADSFNTIIQSDYIFYQDVVDYRWVRLKSTDAIPSEFAKNEYNKLGLAAMLHRRVSEAEMTLFSVPEESLTAMENVLAEIRLNISKYGYAIVPLWMDSQVNNLISAFVASLEANREGFAISYVAEGLKEITPYFGMTASTSQQTTFETGYGLLYGQLYGEASD